MVNIFYDFETTGLDSEKCAIWQIAMAIEVDGKVVEVFNRKIKPYTGAIIHDAALNVGHITREDLDSFENESIVFYDMLKMLSKYDKGFLIGYNNLKFDDFFMRKWLDMHGMRFTELFNKMTMDALALSVFYTRNQEVTSYKQSEIARLFNIEVEDEKLHDALYDIVLTRKIFNYLQNEL